MNFKVILSFFILDIVQKFECIKGQDDPLVFQITFSDFVAAILSKKLIKNKEIIQFAFCLLDVNGKGTITPLKLQFRSELNNILIEYKEIADSFGSTSQLDYTGFEHMILQNIKTKNLESSTGSENILILQQPNTDPQQNI